MSLVCISYIVAGFAWYTIDVSLFNSMLISGTTLLGLRIIGGLFSKKKDADK
jgi:hypothetical protein